MAAAPVRLSACAGRSALLPHPALARRAARLRGAGGELGARAGPDGGTDAAGQRSDTRRARPAHRLRNHPGHRARRARPARATRPSARRGPAPAAGARTRDGPGRPCGLRAPRARARACPWRAGPDQRRCPARTRPRCRRRPPEVRAARGTGCPARPAAVAASCHDADELARAQALGCDFAVLGPVLPTRSHPGAPVLGWTAFAARVEPLELPVLALGGLAPADLERARSHGAHGIAMQRAAWSGVDLLEDGSHPREGA